ncbi:hypothetical protein [Cyanobium gracile]|uniref:hypothetical protein n=1 Tax=Cyanobium gracile TaxID=59930 RepID=UPI002B201788|nr:hypothetical protein [Cyanobium gracile]
MLMLPVLVAIGMVAGYLHDPGALWRDPYHDRNSHLTFGLGLALALRSGDLGGLLHDLVLPSAWPPLHGILLGGVLAVLGPDHRFAVLPSIGGWLLAVLGLWPLCRAALNDPLRGDAAGSIAVAFAVGSPAFRLLGSDVMLEGLGAGLTVVVLWAFLQQRWRLLSVLLTLLFLEKYNYWAMALVAIGAAALPVNWPLRLQRALASLPWRTLRDDPFLLLGLLMAGGVVLLPGEPPLAVAVGSVRVTLLPSSLLAIAVGFIVLGSVRAWKARAVGFDQAIGPAGEALLAWHGLPLAFWLMIPGKFAGLLWFLGPTNRNPDLQVGLFDRLAGQWEGFAHGFSVGSAVALAVLLCALIGARRSSLLVWFVGLGVLALLLHPQQQMRFQATVLPGVWALAGLGAGEVVEGMGARWLPRTPLIALVLGTALLATPVPALADAAAIRRPAAPRDLNLAAAWADVVPDPGGVIALTSIGRTDLVEWTIRTSCRCRVPIQQPTLVSLPDRAAVLAAVERTLAETPAQSLITIHLGAPYPLPGLLTKDPDALAAALEGALARQTRFVSDRSIELPDQGARVELWSARPGVPLPVRPHGRYLAESVTTGQGLLALGVLLRPRTRAGGPWL